MRNIKVGEVANANIHIDLTYDHETGDRYPVVQNIVVENMTSEKSEYVIYIKADEKHPVRNIKVVHSSFKNVKKENFLQGIEGLVLNRVEINGKTLNS